MNQYYSFKFIKAEKANNVQGRHFRLRKLSRSHLISWNNQQWRNWKSTNERSLKPGNNPSREFLTHPWWRCLFLERRDRELIIPLLKINLNTFNCHYFVFFIFLSQTEWFAKVKVVTFSFLNSWPLLVAVNYG